MAKEKSDLVYGTLDMLILKSLQHEPRHGLGIADRIQQMSRDILRVEQGSLYPALYRLEAQGWIRAEWGVSENNRKARYYKLPRLGGNNSQPKPSIGPGLPPESILSSRGPSAYAAPARLVFPPARAVSSEQP